MKRRIKNIAGIAMAATMALSCATGIFAAPQSTTVKGTIDANSLKLAVKLPTMSMVIKPYNAPQIFAGGLIQNESTEIGSKYDISLAGYTAVLTSKTDDNIVPVTAITAGEAKKEVAMTIKIAAPVAGAIGTTPTEADVAKAGISAITGKAAWGQAALASGATAETQTDKDKYDYIKGASGGVTEAVKSASEEDYKNSESTFTKAESTAKVTLENKEGNDGSTPAKKVVDKSTSTMQTEIAVYGTMNTDGDWAVGDTISVTPVIKISPVVDGAVATS